MSECCRAMPRAVACGRVTHPLDETIRAGAVVTALIAMHVEKPLSRYYSVKLHNILIEGCVLV